MKAYKAVFDQSQSFFRRGPRINVSYIRELTKDEQIHEIAWGYGGLWCSRMIGDKTYVYRLCADPDRDGILVDLSENERNVIICIHRGKVFLLSHVPDKKMPSIRKLRDNVFAVEISKPRKFYVCMFACGDFVYLSTRSEYVFTINVNTMEFLPPLQMDVLHSIEAFSVSINGEINLRTEDPKLNDYHVRYSVTAHLPREYYAITPRTPMTEFESEFLKKFKPVKILGQGAFGCVFEAENLMDKWKYAVKRIALRGSDEVVNDALKEVRTLASLNHEGIVRYNSCWLEKPPSGWQKKEDARLLKTINHREMLRYKDDCVFVYIQMEICKQTLHDYLQAHRTRSITRAKMWFKQLVSAVGYLHTNKKIHRDLKPCNILLDKDGRVKICDLGLVANRALTNGQEVDRTLTVAGTPMYMAPEQHTGNYNSKVDIFSLGLILVELCVYMEIEQAYDLFMKYRRGKSTSILKHLPEVEKVDSWLANVDASKRPTCEQILSHEFLA